MTEDIVYFDTFVFMDILSDDEKISEKAQQILKNHTGIVSAIVFTELYFHITRKATEEDAEEIIIYISSIPNLKILDVTPDIARTAGRIRSKYHKKLEKDITYFDSIHIATAIDAKCTKFITGDRAFLPVSEINVDLY